LSARRREKRHRNFKESFIFYRKGFQKGRGGSGGIGLFVDIPPACQKKGATASRKTSCLFQRRGLLVGQEEKPLGKGEWGGGENRQKCQEERTLTDSAHSGGGGGESCADGQDEKSPGPPRRKKACISLSRREGKRRTNRDEEHTVGSVRRDFV